MTDLAEDTAARTKHALRAFAELAVSGVDFQQHAALLKIIERACRDQNMPRNDVDALSQSAHIAEAAHAFMVAVRSTPLGRDFETQVKAQAANGRLLAEAVIKAIDGSCDCENCKAKRDAGAQKDQVH